MRKVFSLAAGASYAIATMTRVAGTVAAVGAICLVSTPANAAGGEVAVIVKTANSPYWQNVQRGAAAGINELPDGYLLSFQGPAAESDVAAQVDLVNSAVRRKVAGIVLAPSDPDALVPAIKKAWEAKIPVVIIDSAIADSGKQYYQAYLATDNAKAGELCAEALINKVGTTGKVAIMSYVAGTGSEAARVGGFRRYLTAHSQLQVVGPYYSQSDIATALKQTTDTLAANPDLKGIFGANEATTVGMGRALVQSGKSGKVVAVGFDGDKELQNFVRTGTIDAIAVQGSYRMGEMGVRTLGDVINRRPLKPVVDTGVVIVTKATLDSSDAKQVLY
jgi:ribose transport system substrate-binding protein